MTEYEKNSNAIRLHNFPRLGHTNEISKLADETMTEEYSDGLKAFPIAIACFFVTWALVLLALKHFGGLDRVGCAAGGEAIDVKLLKDIGFRRYQRRQIIRRSWRLQFVFGICSIGLICFSFVFANRGITPFMDSLDEIATTSSLAQTRIRHSLHLGNLLSVHMQSLRPVLAYNISELCPNYEQTFLESEYAISTTSSAIAEAANMLYSFFDNDLEPFLRGFDEAADSFKYVDEAITQAEKTEWIFRMILAAINIINIFLFLGVVLTRNQVRSHFFQDVLSYAFVPSFALVFLFTVVVFCATTISGMLNADFCSGGDGSPVGTLIDFVVVSGYTRENFLNQLADYFAFENCEGPDPLLFLRELSASLVETSSGVEEMTSAFRGLDFDQLSTQCGSDFQSVNSTFFSMVSPLADVSDAVERLNDLTRCDYVQPVLQEILYGTTCNETMDASAWMFFSSLVICLFMMIMLSTRASLYNTLIPGPKKKRREKEFHQYKDFMQEHGYNTSDWEIDPSKKYSLTVQTETFESEETLSTMQVSPEPRDELAVDASFGQLSTSSDRPSPVQKDSEDISECEVESVYSLDSDDSSLHAPPSVFSGVAVSVASTLALAVSRFKSWSGSKSKATYRNDSDTHSRRQSMNSTPQKSPVNLLGILNADQNESDMEDSEIFPLSPIVEPPAPRKKHTKMQRTRGANGMEQSTC